MFVINLGGVDFNTCVCVCVCVCMCAQVCVYMYIKILNANIIVIADEDRTVNTLLSETQIKYTEQREGI